MYMYNNNDVCFSGKLKPNNSPSCKCPFIGSLHVTCFLVHWVNDFDKQCKCTTFLRGIMQPFLLKLCKNFLSQSAVFY